VQVKVLSVSEKSRDYAKQVADRLSEAGIRVVNDARDEKIGYKIREAQLDRVPYMLVIGEKEAESGTEVAVRSRDKGDMGTMLLVEFISFLKQHIYLRRDDY
jgi:threonyl-tRNA synthetase